MKSKIRVNKGNDHKLIYYLKSDDLLTIIADKENSICLQEQ